MGSGDDPWGTPPGWGDQPTWTTPAGAQRAGPVGGAPGAPAGAPLPWARPRPGIVPLRPLSVGDILDGAFQAIRTNPRTMMGFTAVTLAVVGLLTTVPVAWLLSRIDRTSTGAPGSLARSMAEVRADLAALQVELLPALLDLVLTVVLTGMLAVAVSQAVLGRRTSAGALWGVVRGRIPAMIGQTVLVAVLVLLAVLATVVVGGVVTFVLVNAGGGLAFLGFVTGVLTLVGCMVVGVRLFVVWALAPIALVLEGIGVRAALRRSSTLVRGSFWRVLGILLLGAIIRGIGQSLVSGPFGVAAGALTGDATSFGSQLVATLVTGLAGVIGGAVFYPFYAAVTTLLYTDLRMRREGLDLELMRLTETAPPAGAA